MNSGQEKQASAAFYQKQRARVGSRKASLGISPVSGRSQAELDRQPLSDSDVEAMFAGAPCFKVEESNGRYRPQIRVRVNRYGTTIMPDYEPFGHPAFAQCTLNERRSEELGATSPMSTHTTEAVRSAIDVVETPSMLSERGLDRGAVGFEHFLQLPLADSLTAPDEAALLDKRKLFHSDPEWLGLRQLDLEYLVDRLTQIGELYTSLKAQEWESPQPWNGGKIEEMGEELFGTLLSAELGTTGTGSLSLKTQIIALQRVLNTSELWRDFSVVEWRIRVGQLLWDTQTFRLHFLDDVGQPTERDFLLLQITLAAELLMRLYALEALSHSFPPAISQEESEALKARRTRKIKWDVLLAERFLDNLSIAAKVPSDKDKKSKRVSVLSAVTFFTAKESSSEQADDSTQPILIPKNETQQLAGLVHFAKTLRWPHAQDVQVELESKLSKNSRTRPVSTAISVYGTPLNSPKFPGTPGTRTSFFGFGEQKGHRPGFSRSSTTQLSPARNIAGNIENFEVGGWLSRSWLSGLVMPGEPTTHFLISALLENSPQAITALGEEANLYGGFVYEGRSFWSKSSVIGRVLAASKGAAECMGWISAESGSEEVLETGWISTQAMEAPESASRSRIKDPGSVTRDSDPVRNQDVAALQAGDFTTPADGHLVMGNEVKYHGMSFKTPADPSTVESDAEVATSATASLTFSSPTNSRLAKVEVQLTYEVHFVSSHPCHPKSAMRPSGRKSKTPSPSCSFEVDTSSEPKTLGKGPKDSARPSRADSTLSPSPIEKELPAPPAHPLHIDYHFDIVPAATLLSMASESGPRPRALSSPTERKLSDAKPLEQTKAEMANEDIVVLDCRGGEDLEVLARAWCSKVGENALIGKSGRTCVACCVREARALGVCVVIRT